MLMPPSGTDLIEQSEGLRLKPYKDQGGVWTIGIGSIRDQYGRPITAQTPPITEEAARSLLARDAQSAWLGVLRLFPENHFSDAQGGALLDFAYNLGVAALKCSTLRQQILRGERPPQESWTAWCKVGRPLRVSAGLYARRVKEYQLFVS